MSKNASRSRLRIGSVLAMIGGIGIAGAGWLKNNAIVQLASKVRLGDPSIPIPAGMSAETWARSLESFAQMYLVGAIAVALSVYLGSFIANGFGRRIIGGIVSIAASIIGIIFLGFNIDLGPLPLAATLITSICGIAGGIFMILAARQGESGRLR